MVEAEISTAPVNRLSKEVVDKIFQILKKKNPTLVIEAFTDPESREILGQIALQDETIKKVITSTEQLNYVLEETVGLSFIERIAKNESVTDISFNGTNGTGLTVTTNEGKRRYEIPIEESDIIRLIQKFANAAHQEFTPKHPILDAQLGYMRLNAIHRELAPYGTVAAIRLSHPRMVLTRDTFHLFADECVYHLLEAIVHSRSNIIISGEVGVGKTEFQKLLLSMVPFKQSIFFIEDIPESHLKTLFPEKDIKSVVTGGQTDITTLIKAALRQNAQWIVVSETRGKEAYEMLQAALSGHNIITTLHAYDARAIPSRFVHMSKIGYSFDEHSLYQDIYSYFHFGCHLEKTEVNGHDVRYLSEIIEFHPDGTTSTVYKRWEDNGTWHHDLGKISGSFRQRANKKHVNLLNLPKEWR